MNSSLRQGYCSKCDLRLVWKYKDFGKVMNSSLRQGYCSKCDLRLVWKYKDFGKVSNFICPYCNSKVRLTTYYLVKSPTLKLLKPIKVHDSVYKCPHDISDNPNEIKNCDFECGYDGIIGHQQVHKGINKDSPYYDNHIYQTRCIY